MKRRLKVHKEGYGILLSLISLLVVINIIIYTESPNRMLYIGSLIVSVATFSFFLYFFRNPSREVEVDDTNLVIAPADGRVVVIESVEEWEYFGGKKMIQVSIFMSVLSVHANWYPVSGKVLFTKHHKGRHVAAYLPKSSHENERSTVVIETEEGHQILMRQIAGALARRIVTYAHPGYKCSINEHLGFIKFGSRVDLFFPEGTEIFVEMGESTRGNETILARLPEAKKG